MSHLASPSSPLGMPQSSADRNLLLGAIAVKLQLLDSEELIAATQALANDRSNSLGELLVASGYLTARQLSRLESQVDDYLRQHQGDAQMSLAALQPTAQKPPAESGEGTDDGYQHAKTLSIDGPAAAGRRFRMLRPHAKGGLGQVWVARDDELNREVALKEIQEQFADNASSQSRFILEAEVTGGLEHPGIVPVYGFGRHDDGRPFYAMRFIRGDSFEEAIRRFHEADDKDPRRSDRTRELHKLLGHFLDVCNAIEYAHSRGVLHRDLKPANVMLGRYGETLVVDWGLAKTIGQTASSRDSDEQILQPSASNESSETVMGAAIGTPAFMSPEQAAGRHDQMERTGDVYSLGATLYFLLTGKAPFDEADVGAMLRRVQEGRFSRPREAKSQVPAPLDAICLQAMSLRAEDRYESARRLADDIESWLADEPVAAYTEPFSQRVRRWTRRHRAWVQASALATLIALAIAVVAGFYWWRLPGTLTVAVQPRDARIEIDGVEHQGDANSLEVELSPGVHRIAVSAAGHFSATRQVLIQRGKSQQLSLSLQHHQGILEADCRPQGSEIMVGDTAYGSRIRNLRLDTGRYELTAWSDEHFERQRAVDVVREQRTNVRFWLDRGTLWQYKSASIQGVLLPVPDFNGDGVPEIAHNSLSEVLFLSGKDGQVVKSFQVAGQCWFDEVDMGGDLGRVLVAARDVEATDADAGHVHMFVIDFEPAPTIRWQWKSEPHQRRKSQFAYVLPVKDLTGDSVAELAVTDQTGKTVIVDGQSGDTHKELQLPQSDSGAQPVLRLLEDIESTSVLFQIDVGNPEGLAIAEPVARFVGCVDVDSDEVLWSKTIPRSHGIRMFDMDGDAARDVLWWTGEAWGVVNGRDGTVLYEGPFPDDLHGSHAPELSDLDGDGRLEIIRCGADPQQPTAALRPADGKEIWRRDLRARSAQPQSPNGLLRSPNGDLLMYTTDGLAAISPASGETRWQVEGTVEAAILADWDGDLQDEILVGVQQKGLLCLDAEGRVLWSLRMKLDLRPHMALPDIDGDGMNEIVIHQHGALVGLVRGPRILWQAKAAGPLMAAPLVGDLTGDNKPEVIQLGDFGEGRRLICLDGTTGAERWSIKNRLPNNRAPAVADWDGDGLAEVVTIGPNPDNNGYELMVLRGTDGEAIYRHEIGDGGETYSTPVVADFSGDGQPDVASHRWQTRDIIAIDRKQTDYLWQVPTAQANIGGVEAADISGDGRPEVIAPSGDGHVYALDGPTGEILWKAPIGTPMRARPTVDDLDDDGRLEVLIMAPAVLPEGVTGQLHVLNGQTGESVAVLTAEDATPCEGHAVVVHTAGGTRILAPLGNAGVVAFDWESRRPVWQTGLGKQVVTSPVVCDLDDDGVREVVTATADGTVAVYDLVTGQAMWSLRVGSDLISGDPAVADVNGDGALDIIVADHGFTLTAISGWGTRGARRRLGAL